jgi:hypothetical protein
VEDQRAGCGSRMRHVSGTHREMITMHHLMMNLPTVGTLGLVALLAGPLARLPIDLGAWLLTLVRSTYELASLSCPKWPRARRLEAPGWGTMHDETMKPSALAPRR